MILHYYHELWAEIFDKPSLYHSIRDKSYEDLHCGSANFSTKYQMDNPNNSDIDAALFVVDQWMKISDSLGLEIPYEKIRSMFKNSKSININQKLL